MLAKGLSAPQLSKYFVILLLGLDLLKNEHINYFKYAVDVFFFALFFYFLFIYIMIKEIVKKKTQRKFFKINLIKVKIMKKKKNMLIILKVDDSIMICLYKQKG